jgi:hypothetical protein
VGLVLSVVSIVMITQLLIPSEHGLTRTLAGFDIVYDCTDLPTVFVALTPISDLPAIRVDVYIENWKQLGDNCTEIQVYFPGVTYDHMYLVAAELPQTSTPSYDEWQALTYEATRVPLVSGMELIWDPLLCQDIMRIRPQQLVDFVGAIEFIWMDCYRNVGFAGRGIFLPFTAPMPVGVQVSAVQNYSLFVWCPSGYDLISSRPAASRFQLLGDRGYYLFDIDTSTTDFYAVFESNSRARMLDYLLILLSTLFGIGLALTVQEAMAFIRNRSHETGLKL